MATSDRTPEHRLGATKGNLLAGATRKPGSYVGNFDELLSQMAEDTAAADPATSETPALPADAPAEPASRPASADAGAASGQGSPPPAPAPDPVKRLNVEVPQSLHRQLKQMAAVQETTVKDIVTGLLRDYVAANAPPASP